jgi:hypothetical protein
MRSTVLFIAAAGVLLAGAAAAATPESRRCAAEAHERGLAGAAAESFERTCEKGALEPKAPTAPAGPRVEGRAIVAPSGADRTKRARECVAEENRKRLSGRARKEFHLSCLATAGPPSEAQSHLTTPRPAKAIPGIGVNSKAEVAPR